MNQKKKISGRPFFRDSRHSNFWILLIKNGLSEELKQYLESRWQNKAKEAKPAAAGLVTVSKPNKTKLRKKKADSGPKAWD